MCHLQCSQVGLVVSQLCTSISAYIGHSKYTLPFFMKINQHMGNTQASIQHITLKIQQPLLLSRLTFLIPQQSSSPKSELVSVLFPHAALHLGLYQAHGSGNERWMKQNIIVITHVHWYLDSILSTLLNTISYQTPIKILSQNF